MGLEKLTIREIEKITPDNQTVTQPLFPTVFEVQYNPTTLPTRNRNRFNKAPNFGDNVPEVTYAGGDGKTVTLSLWFDTSDTVDNFFGATSVTSSYAQLRRWSLTPADETEPPHLLVQWGSYFEFVGVIENISEDFTLWMPDGKPIRALVKVCFRELLNLDVEGSLGATNPTSRSEARKTWMVEHGQRLDWIAYQEYGDSSLWRHIAEVNDLDDPGDLYPGQILKLTPV